MAARLLDPEAAPALAILATFFLRPEADSAGKFSSVLAVPGVRCLAMVALPSAVHPTIPFPPPPPPPPP
eukprot:CAMPEP_0183317658 /NCGR_PEP_ID=MMETSP0160_2-20130417/58562_1 /TAXON_ID=2839 ORGANISM="Odontella Sinensis, Strain Grunow 1884" /NCGR_SAMPLE_ID=MMETSP0160_2 /ASSEMBLY_ACC=CAM_ASM_000250 /LENGTH=68 /DNA_ID=CAMNT_0025483735 /DNA_START=36 /DNA_END=238 /DNA_ORIENTATION=+